MIRFAIKVLLSTNFHGQFGIWWFDLQILSMLLLIFRSIFSWQSQLSQQQQPCFSSCALSAVYFSWPAQVQIFRQTKISQKFIKKSSFLTFLGLTCFILRWKVKFKRVFLVMDESAKSGVRTRKRNKSIKDSAKLVSHKNLFWKTFVKSRCISN